jgi:hypothetical protein
MTASALQFVSSIFTAMSSPPWLFGWELTELLSIIIIGIGCLGEVWSEHHVFCDSYASPSPVKSKKDKFHRLFGWMVVGGLAIELFAFLFSFLASNHEIEGLKSDNIAHEKQVEDLRKKNDEIEAQMLPRFFADPAGAATNLSKYAGTRAVIFCNGESLPSGLERRSLWEVVDFA